MGREKESRCGRGSLGFAEGKALAAEEGDDLLSGSDEGVGIRLGDVNAALGLDGVDEGS